MKGSGIPGGGG